MLKNLLFFIFAITLSISCVAKIKHKPTKRYSVPVTQTEESFLITDNNGNVIKEYMSNVQRPIASISKLMVALLAVNQNLDEQLVIPKTRTVTSSIPYKQQMLSRRELLTLSLVRSDNFATQILCNNIPNCIDAMNDKAKELGMTNTHYDEPTGLSKNNVSTASDLIKLMIEASYHQTITEISSMPNAEIATGKNKIKVKNTNPLTNKLDIFLSKTGFTNPAGQCLVMAVFSPVGQRFMVLLGSRNRILEMEKLYKDLS